MARVVSDVLKELLSMEEHVLLLSSIHLSVDQTKFMLMEDVSVLLLSTQ